MNFSDFFVIKGHLFFHFLSIDRFCKHTILFVLKHDLFPKNTTLLSLQPMIYRYQSSEKTIINTGLEEQEEIILLKSCFYVYMYI